MLLPSNFLAFKILQLLLYLLSYIELNLAFLSSCISFYSSHLSTFFLHYIFRFLFCFVL
ncbi:uncharacterized protein DS421_11g349770 [Arachis hypogaea]|nr:uncharacterized protein DS421_11g349770 [Arachis hypogaea]